MLTEEQIKAGANDAYNGQASSIATSHKIAWTLGATWANEQNAQEIAELVEALRLCVFSMGEREGNVLGWQRKPWKHAVEILAKHGIQWNTSSNP